MALITGVTTIIAFKEKPPSIIIPLIQLCFTWIFFIIMLVAMERDRNG